MQAAESRLPIVPLRTELNVPGITRTFRILHVTDLHACLMDEDETQAHKDYNTPRIRAFSGRDGITAAERFPDLIQAAREEQVDLLLLTGDIVDQPCDANLRLLHETLNACPVPYLYIPGNHDWSFADDYHTPHAISLHRPKFLDLCGGNLEIQSRETDELLIVGLDNGPDDFTDAQLDALELLLQKKKPTLVATHVPLTTPYLAVRSVEQWKRDINLGKGGIDSPRIQRFRRMVTAPDSPVFALVCGHLHYNHEDTVETVPQILTGCACNGTCRVITVTGT
jgi:3',5'-cyclic AMP phosphodiesterase CpdA